MALRKRSQERLVTVFSDWILCGHHECRYEGEDPAMWENPQIAEAKPHEVIERRRAIPPDTRSITAIICGDPIPGRRAIDKRQVA